MINDKIFEHGASVSICSKCLDGLHKNNKVCFAIERENRFCQKIIMFDNLATDLSNRLKKLSGEVSQEEIAEWFKVEDKHTKRDTYK